VASAGKPQSVAGRVGFAEEFDDFDGWQTQGNWPHGDPFESVEPKDGTVTIKTHCGALDHRMVRADWPEWPKEPYADVVSDCQRAGRLAVFSEQRARSTQIWPWRKFSASVSSLVQKTRRVKSRPEAALGFQSRPEQGVVARQPTEEP